MQREQSVGLILMLIFALELLSLYIPGTCRAESPISLYDTTIKSSNILETELLRMTNQNRVQRGLAPLIPDESLIQIARKQSAGMAGQGFLSHVLPSGDLRSRMRFSGYRYKTVRENVASSSSLSWAYNALLESPVHRDNILAEDVNRVGIGIVRCQPPYEKELYITEIFAGRPEVHQPVEIQDILLGQIEDLRKNGAGALVADPLLEKLASDSALAFNPSVPGEDFRSMVAHSAAELQKSGLSKVNINMQLLRDPKNLKIESKVDLGLKARSFGTAIRQVVDSSNEPTFLVLTLIGFAN
jgi:hypothetical protein